MPFLRTRLLTAVSHPSILSYQKICFEDSIEKFCVLESGRLPSGVEPSVRAGPRGRADSVRLHGGAPQQGAGPADRSGFASLRADGRPLVFGSHQVLVGGRSRARIRRGRRAERRGRDRAGVCRSDAASPFQPSRRHGAGSGWHHQRASRTTDLSWRRAHLRRHSHRADDVARHGRGGVWRSGRGFSYRAYLLPGLDATGFTAEEGIKDGRQQGGQADASDPAVAGRMEYRQRGLTAGGSFWTGAAASV